MNLAETIIAAGRCENEDDANDAIAAMLSPVNDRQFMGETYNTIMGYNPLDYFSKKEIGEELKDLYQEIPSLEEYVKSEEIDDNKIIDLAQKIHETHRSRDQMISLKESLGILCPGIPRDISKELEEVISRELPEDAFADTVEDDNDIEEEDDDEIREVHMNFDEEDEDEEEYSDRYSSDEEDD